MTIRRTLAASLCLAGLLGQLPVSAQSPPVWLPTLEAIVEREMASKGFPSFALVFVDRGVVVAQVVRGSSDAKGGAPVTAHTLYRTGSVGKTLTDLAVMVATERGKLDLDADVRNYLPEFEPENPFGAPITLRHLMTHTAGLVREPPIGNYFDATSPTLGATVRSLNGTTLLWRPGSRTKYSNAGLAVVGRVLEAVYGTGYADVLRRLVFEPAGMRTAVVGRPVNDRDDVALGIMQRPDGTIRPAPTFDLGMVPAGDLYASIADMGAFLVSLLDGSGRVGRPATVSSMWTPFPPRERWQLEVGLGFSLNGTFAGRYRLARNGGAVYGFATELALLPEEGLGVYAVAAKDLANGTVQAIAHWTLLAAIADRRGEPVPEYELTPIPFRDVSADIMACSTEPDELPDSNLLGVYGPEHNPLVICRKDGRLHAAIEWMFLYPLQKRDDGGFAFPSYALYGHETLHFARSGGRVTAVIGAGSEGVRFRRR